MLRSRRNDNMEEQLESRNAADDKNKEDIPTDEIEKNKPKRRRTSLESPQNDDNPPLNEAKDESSEAPLFPQQIGTLHRVSWNAGAKATIRTSLKRQKPNSSVDRSPMAVEQLSKSLVQDHAPVQDPSPEESGGSAGDHSPVSQGGQKDKPEHSLHSIQAESSMIVEPSPEPPLPALSEPQPELEVIESEGSEDGVVLNFIANGQESGEISETQSPSSHAVADEESPSEYEPEEFPMELRGDSDSDQDDAMMEYSDSNQPMKSPRSKRRIPADKEQTYQSTALAELREEAVYAQLRYFYIAHDHGKIDFKTTPVRCLVCSANGHMAAYCPKLTCPDCGSYNDHCLQLCPKTRRCRKCLERGHDQSQCKVKLKALTHEVICDLCSQVGHMNEDCEMIWRTSGPPTYPHQFRLDGRKNIFCYECGGNGHLGNNCPTRRPGKPMGTSTWSLAPQVQVSQPVSIRSKGEMNIKGRAQQKMPPISPDSQFDQDQSNFVRPKVPAPNKSGQIRIQAPRQDKGALNSFSRDSNQLSGSSLQHVHDPRYSRSGTNKRGQPPQQKRIFDYYSPANAYQPPLPREPPPPRVNKHPGSYNNSGNSGEYYRPMPSAGQNAWRQHRA